jgi:hypothetical protein
MSETRFNIAIDDAGEGSATIFAEGEVVTITHDHAHFAQIVNALVTGQDPARYLNVASAITRIDSRVTIEGNAVYFDGEEVHNTLTATILRYAREGRPTSGLVRFLERLFENPSKRSRDQLFDWVSAGDLTIDTDGFFIGWKGVSNGMTSISSGTASVDGVVMSGHIPNAVGSIIEMPRASVQDDPTIGCHTGLHVGTYEYANGFGQILLEVKVDPADVVSVPVDSGFQKLRCCRYEVLAVHQPERGSEWNDDYEPESEWDLEFYDDDDEWRGSDDDDEYGGGWGNDDEPTCVEGDIESLAPVLPEKAMGKIRKLFRRNA